MAHSSTHPKSSIIPLQVLYVDVSEGLTQVLQEWELRRRRRVELRRLLLMGPELIADFGMTMQEAEFEAGQPFWRPLQSPKSHLP